MKTIGYLLFMTVSLNLISCSSGNEHYNKEIGIVNKVTDDSSYAESGSQLPSKQKGSIPAQIMDVPAIINLKEEEVNKIMGDPYSSEKTVNGIRKYYSNEKANVEITYNSKKADLIKILPKYEIPFEKESLKYINVMPKAKHTYNITDKVIMLKGMEQYDEVAIYPDSNKSITSYFIKTCTPAN